MEKKRKKFQAKSQHPLFKKACLKLGNQVLLSALLLVAALIATKKSTTAKEVIYSEVYQKNFQFATVSHWYNEHFGSLFPLKNTTEPVFQESLVYQSSHLYQDGVELEVANQYMVPVLESGIIVFVGEKEGYGSTVIVQQVDGTDVWYGNVTIHDLSLYDYVEKGTLLGETKSTKLYLAFQKEGAFVDYKEYLA